MPGDVWGRNSRSQPTKNGVPRFLKAIYDSGFVNTGTDMAAVVAARDYARYKFDILLHVQSGTLGNGIRLAELLAPSGMSVLAVANFFGNFTFHPDQFIPSDPDQFDFYRNLNYTFAAGNLPFRDLWLATPGTGPIYIADEPVYEAQGWHTPFDPDGTGPLQPVNLVTNGAFATDLSGWTQTGPTLATWSAGVAVLSHPPAGPARIVQTISGITPVVNSYDCYLFEIALGGTFKPTITVTSAGITLYSSVHQTAATPAEASDGTPIRPTGTTITITIEASALGTGQVDNVQLYVGDGDPDTRPFTNTYVPKTRGLDDCKQLHAYSKSVMPNQPTQVTFLNDNVTQWQVWSAQPICDWIGCDIYTIGTAPEDYPHNGSPALNPISSYGYMNFTVAESAALARHYAPLYNRVPVIVLGFLKFGSFSRFITMSEMWSHMVASVAELRGVGVIYWWAFGVQLGALEQRPFFSVTAGASQTVFAMPDNVDEVEDVEVKISGTVTSPSNYTVQHVGDRTVVYTSGAWRYVNPGTVTMNTAPGAVNVVVTVYRYPAAKRAAVKQQLEDMTDLLDELEPILIQPSNPALVTANSNNFADFRAWRTPYCNLLRSNPGGDRPVWLFGAISRYQAEYDDLISATPTYSISAHMMDQRANVRVACWQSGDIGIVAAHNVHPDAQNNVTLQWWKPLTRVEVLGEGRDVPVTGGRSWTDTYGGASSKRQGPFNTGHLYRLYTSAQGNPPTVTYIGTPTGGVDAVTLPFAVGVVENDIALLIVQCKNPDTALPSISGSGGFTWNFMGYANEATSRQAVWWARAPASHSAVTLADTGDHTFGVILGVRGCKLTGDPINAQVIGQSIVPQATTTIPGLTTTVDNCLILDLVHLDGPDWAGSNNFSNWANAAFIEQNEVLDRSTPAGVGATVGVFAFTTEGAAGPVPATTVTHPSQMSLWRKIALAPEPNPVNNATLSVGLGAVGLVATGTAVAGPGDLLLNTTLANATLAATGTVSGGAPGAYPTFVGAGTSTASVDAITPPLPTGLLVNDILVLLLQTNGPTIGVANAAGGTWAQVALFNPAVTGIRLSAYWSRYNGTQTAPTTTDSGDHQLGRVVAIRGCPTSGTPMVSAYGAPFTAQTASAIPAVTTIATNSLVMDIIAGESPAAAFTGWANAALENVVQRFNDTTAVGVGGSLAAATGGKATIGDTGTTAVTHASSKIAYMKIAFTPIPGTQTPLTQWDVDARGRVLLNNAPKQIRMVYDSGAAGANSTDMAGHVAARDYARWAGKLNVVLNEHSGSEGNTLRLCDALLPYGMYVVCVGNAFGGATVDQMSGLFSFDVVINPDGFRSKFAAKANAAAIELGNEPQDSVLTNMVGWNTTYMADMPNLECYTILFQDPIGQVLTFAPSATGRWFGADPYPIGNGVENDPDGDGTPSTYGYMNFSVGQAAARIRYHALLNGKAPFIVCPMWKMGTFSRFITPDEMWSHMVAVFAEGCSSIVWWAFGVQQGALDSRPVSQAGGDGVRTVFDVPCYFEEAGDVEVAVAGVIQAPAAYTLQGMGVAAGPWTVTLTTPPPAVPITTPPTINVVVTANRWPSARRALALDTLEAMTTFLADNEGIMLSDPVPALLTANSTSTGNPLTWRRNLCSLLSSGAADRPVWWFGVRNAYLDEFTRLNQTPPDTSLSDQMLDQSGNVRTRCWIGPTATQAFVFAYNIHPDAQNNVTLQWANTVFRVEVIGEDRDVALGGDSRSWTDTFGGGSSLRQGARRQGHVYKLHLTGAPPPTPPGAPSLTSLGASSTTSVGLGMISGLGALTHGLYRGDATAFPRDSAHLIASFTTTVPTTYLDTALTPNTTYFYRLVATNDGGSAESSEVSVTTQAAAEVPTGLFWEEGQLQFLPWPGRLLSTSAGTYEFALQTQPGAAPAAVTGYVVLLDAGDIGEIVHDVAIAVTTGSRLLLTKTYRAIKSVSLTLIDDGGTAVTARVIDKDPTLGPLIRCYNAAGAVVAGHVDAGIVGY